MRFTKYFRMKQIAISFLIIFIISLSTVLYMYNSLDSTTSVSKNKKLKLIRQYLRDFNIIHEKQISELLNGDEISLLPTIYIVTPTYYRILQQAELTRIIQTFKHIKNVQLIIVEDSDTPTELVTRVLVKSRIRYTQLFAKTPMELKLKKKDKNWLKPRGVLQRNEGLRWLRENVLPDEYAVVYFADDDNTYALRLFDEMRFTKKVSVWPVAFVAEMKYERPIVNHEKVVAWETAFRPDRNFALDMAGFAVNINLVRDHPNAVFSNDAKRGFLENDFLTSLGVEKHDLEPRADMCTTILVWHTRTSAVSLKNDAKFKYRTPMITDL